MLFGNLKNISKQLLSLILPINALIIVPFLIENRFSVLADEFLIVGTGFMIAGLVILTITITMFIRIGKGTLAPWSPTSKLVASGIYAHVRNPMISGVMAVLLGEALIFHSVKIFIWLITFFVINTVYFIVFEEPGLVKRFGDAYIAYRQNVPRWIPRLKPWEQGAH